jgi:cobaltochelatase CobS
MSKKDAHGNERIECLECGAFYHRLDVHLNSKHKMSPEEYQAKHEGAPVLSEHAKATSDSEPTASAPKAKAKKAAKAKAKPEPKGNVYKIGVARLQRLEKVPTEAKPFIPLHDENWLPGTREKGQLEDLAVGIEDRENVLLVGPTGCGKSTLVMQLASALEQPLFRANLHGDVRAADFIGEKLVEVDEASGQSVVVWKDGLLPKAMRHGYWLLLDELDAAPASILFVLQAVLEDGGKLVLTGNGGEVVEKHPNFRIIATANTLGRGDESGLYTGTHILNEAFLDRFGMVIDSGYPNPETEVRILESRCGIAPDIAKRMTEVAAQIREAYEREECFCTFSTRRLIAWAGKSVRYGNVTRASKVTVLNKLSGDDAKLVQGVIQRHFDGK